MLLPFFGMIYWNGFVNCFLVIRFALQQGLLSQNRITSVGLTHVKIGL